MKRPAYSAIFVDRDGVINRAGRKEYVWTREAFRYLSGAIEGLKALRALCARLIVVTNQSGIGQGLYAEADYRALRDWYHADLLERGIRLDAEYRCPHHPELGVGAYRTACGCRKPAAGMLIEASVDFGLDLSSSCVVIGDAARDMRMAKTAGCLAVHVATGPEPGIPPEADLHVMDLPAAAERLRRMS